MRHAPSSEFMLRASAALCMGACLALLSACGGSSSNSGGASVPASPVADGGSGTPTPAPGDPDETDAAPPAPPPPTARLACADLAGMQVAGADIGVPSGSATVTEATAIAADAAGNALGGYCKVRGTIAPMNPSSPVINFALNLPQAWNRKAMQFGGGGFNGRLIDGTEQIRFGPIDKPAPLALGYATYGDDSGHQSSSITDARFAADDEALANYGGLSLKKTHDVAHKLLAAFYGEPAAKAYFLGTSTGGRDALGYIQRWPQDYDGVIANEPALNYSGTRLSNVALGRALYANGGAGWLNLSKTLRVQQAALAACDGLDGVADGIVSNVESCRLLNAQVLASLRCAGGADTGNDCLSDVQLATVRTVESPLDLGYPLAHGVTRAGGYNLLEGALVAGPFTTRDLGTRPVPGNPATSADANMYLTGDQWAKYFVTRDAAFDSLGFDPVNPGAWTQRVQDVSAATDALDADLSPFFARGGRLILLHGLADEVISPNSTIDYHQRLAATVGQAAMDAHVRFYTVPGMGHGTGVFIPNWDSLAALEAWVEKGLAPGTAVAVDAVAGTYGRTRPLCLYPSWPKYRGSGSKDAAVNYSCVSETPDPLACPYLPGSVASYKGGNTLGEELSVQIDPATLAYTITVEASAQRSAGTTRSGTLMPRGQCSYDSGEGGAVFTLATGGVLLGGVAAPSGGSFAPLLAFQNTWDNEASPTVFNPAALIANAVGVQQAGAAAETPTVLAVRLRNAGTYQYCADPVTGGAMIYDAACTQTEKGYIARAAGRRAFDAFTTSPTGGATTSGGSLSGSMVIGMAGSTLVHMHLLRDGTRTGMRLLATQLTLTPGSADGSYAVASSRGDLRDATLAGTSLDLGGAAATLSYDAPVLGLAQADAARPGQMIFNGGILAFAAGDATHPAFELGVRH
ncbi:tannase/feruloyl esterase family alpha/beta hydrolase [Variovorax dokdonensis]|uniref:Tannase/feruloyl esterase family alpha/beta hydrolase n=1 Tax=Variovorax dokdonensis TaxID=344883 RepID=A0ABT7N5U6_9BURK|nr:tannase/feruloyl esterase family alpha/beta hydrolase [Variovorax dokdonensis]MDM0043277.1 tannase/feruloyl esterase family alpha/beta hydrolase [Variovorax dokdonensis]